MNQNQSTIPSFIQFREGENFDREFYIAHTTLKRFPLGVIMLILVGLAAYVVPGVILIVYFALRKKKISHGYAAITDKRVIYYEFNSHPAVNYQHMRSLHVEEITGMQFRIDHKFWRKSFWMRLQTDEVAMLVGARGYLSLLKGRGSTKILEPGPDSVEFIQVMSGEVAARKFAKV